MSGQKHNLANVGARTYAASKDGPDAQFSHPDGERGSWLSSLAYAPLDRRSLHWGMIALSWIAEMLGTFVFVFVVNLGKASITGSMTSVETFLAGTFLGIIGGLTYYLASGWNIDSPDADYYELPKHLSWTVSLAHTLLFRTGWLMLVFYLLAQTCGSLLASGFLFFLGKGTLPTPLAANMGTTWFVEIFGVFCIIFPMLFKHLAGATLTEEDARVRNSQFYAAGGRVFATSILFQFQGYSFDPVIYLGGLVALCDSTGCPNSTPFGGAVAFYILVPLLGAMVACVFYAVALLFISCVGWCGNKRVKRRGRNRDDARNYPTAATQGPSAVPIQASASGSGETKQRKTTTAADLDKYQ